jgi:uncharacterized protein YcbX
MQAVDRARVGKPGLLGDRAFVLLDERDRVATIRDHFPLLQLRAAYDADRDELALTMPDGRVVSAVVARGDERVARMFGERDVPCHEVVGPWSEALTAFTGLRLRLARTAPGQGFDGFPVSLCSTASVRRLADVAGRSHVDERRFRQNIMIDGVEPHEEDSWIGSEVRIGEVVLRMKMRDERCVVTTRDPDTGDHDLDTLKLVASYRTDQPNEVNFGVYATVAREGVIGVGDPVQVVAR